MPQWTDVVPQISGHAGRSFSHTADQLSYQAGCGRDRNLPGDRAAPRLRPASCSFDGLLHERGATPGPGCTSVSADVVRVDPPIRPFYRQRNYDIYPGQPTVIADDRGSTNKPTMLFEAMESLQFLYADHNELRFYSWSDQRCCLPKGVSDLGYSRWPSSAAEAGYDPHVRGSPGSGKRGHAVRMPILARRHVVTAGSRYGGRNGRWRAAHRPGHEPADYRTHLASRRCPAVSILCLQDAGAGYP